MFDLTDLHDLTGNFHFFFSQIIKIFISSQDFGNCGPSAKFLIHSKNFKYFWRLRCPLDNFTKFMNILKLEN